ncbi:MAG: hypothetical protein ABIB97_00835 [Patescibacteria group bacterium]
MAKLVKGKFLAGTLGIFQVLFLGSLVFYLMILVIENLIEGAVSNTLSPNYILAVVFITGILSIFAPQAKPEKKEAAGKSDYYLISALAVIGAVLIYIKMKEMGNLAWPVAILTGVLILMVGFLLLRADDKEQPS